MSMETWISIASALFAGASAAFAGLQTRDSRRAAKGQVEDGKKLAEAAERSAHAAEESAILARSALEVGRRAWLTIQNLSIHQRDSGSAIPLIVRLVIHNGGFTPGVDVRGAFNLFEAVSLPAELPQIPQSGLGTIGPGNSAERYIQPENNMLPSPGVPISDPIKHWWGNHEAASSIVEVVKKNGNVLFQSLDFPFGDMADPSGKDFNYEEPGISKAEFHRRVALVQVVLAAHFHTDIVIDGCLGPDTEEHLRTFAKENNLPSSVRNKFLRAKLVDVARPFR